MGVGTRGRALGALALLVALAGCRQPSGPGPGHATGAFHGSSHAHAAEPLLADPRQLTFAGRRSGEGYFDRGGSRLVFQSEREPGNPFYQIYLMDLTTGGTQRISPGRGKTTCGWVGPGGRRVLFASTHLDPESDTLQRVELEDRASGRERRYQWDYDPHFDLFVRELGAGGELGPLRALAPARGYDAEGAISPDGRWIVFASNRHAYDPVFASAFDEEDRARLEIDPAHFIDLYLMDARGGSLRRLTTSPGYDGGPFFSPDGERVVWRRFSEDGASAEIFSMRTDGSDVRQLTRLGALSWAPFYHPSGDYVVFSTNLHGFGNFELYAVDAAGERDPVRVTTSPKFDGLPSFTPDGATLAWTSQRTPDGRSQIFRAGWDDARARRLLDLPAPRRESSAAPLLPLPAHTRAAIDEQDLRAHVTALASDVTDGRLTGTPGEKIATSYVARAFRRVGLEPAGDDGTFFQGFGFTAGVSLGAGNRLSVQDGAATDLTLDVDWRPLAFSRVGEVEPAPVVFAGYGIVAPASADAARFDSYGAIDVEGKWVLAFRYVPEDLPAVGKRRLRRYGSLRHKAMIARDRGALGLLVVSGPRSKVRSELPELSFDASLAGTSIAVAGLSDAAAQRLLDAAGQKLGALQSRVDAGEAGGAFEIPGLRLGAEVDLVQQRRSGRNVLARLATGAAPTQEVVLLGAHVDHLGRGRTTGSLSASDDPDQVHSGADDNASGVAVLIEMAEQLAERQRAGELSLGRDVVFAAWSGEELGLLGSSHYADSFGNPHDAEAGLAARVVAYLNLDMVGRLDDKLLVYGSASSSAWEAEVERANVPVGLPIELFGDAYLPTDSTVFATRGVPVLSAFTGVHEDYHTPNDVAEKIDFAGLADVARLWSSIGVSLASATGRPDFVASAPPSQSVPRAGLRVYLGTVPDYARTDVRGVRLSGVAQGGPADRAGLREGDVIVRVGERAIENIYDYTYALGDLEVDEAVPIVVQRDDAEVTLRVVPDSRD